MNPTIKERIRQLQAEIDQLRSLTLYTNVDLGTEIIPRDKTVLITPTYTISGDPENTQRPIIASK